MLLFFLACQSGDDTPSPDSLGDSADSSDTGPAPEFCSDDEFSQETLDDGSVRVSTPHYTLTVDAAADPQDMGRLLEAAWLAWNDDFGQPSLAPEGPWEITIYSNYDAWVAGLAAKGIAAPAGAGGYYDPGTHFASLYRQPTLYFTQVLFLHEAFHQFHWAARESSVSNPGWYVEGLAEWSSRHDWDGRCVRVGADPRATWEDYWARAASTAEGADLVGWVEGDAFPGRPEMMAFVHHMEELHHQQWREFRFAQDFGEGGTLDLEAASQDYAAHVAASQEPFTPLWLDWLHRGPDTLRGVTGGTIAAVRAKAPPSSFSVRFDTVPGGYAGGLRGWSESGFDVVFVDEAGGVSRWVLDGERNEWLGIGSVPAADQHVWEQDGASLSIDGVPFELDTVLPAAAGHALYGGSADFVVF